MTGTKTTDSPIDPPAGGPDSPAAGRWLRVDGLLPLSLPCLVVAAGLACYGAVMAHRNGPAGTHAALWTLTMMTIALSAAILVLAWYGNRCRIAALQRQLQQLTASGTTHLIKLSDAGELSGLVADLNIYVSQLRNRQARLHLQKRELDIQTRMTEAEKRCVETIVEKIPEAVIVTDAFDEVVLANGAAQEVFGFAPGAAYRQPIHRVLGDPGMVQLIQSMRRPGEPAHRNATVCLNSETAGPRRFRASLTRVVDPRGHVHGVVAVLRPAEPATACTTENGGHAE